VAVPIVKNSNLFDINLSDLPEGPQPLVQSKVAVVIGEDTGSGTVPLPNQRGMMEIVPSMLGRNFQLMAGDGTGMTSDGKLWRNGRLIPMRDLCPVLLQLGNTTTIRPLKSNKHGKYLIQAEQANGATKTAILPPEEVEIKRDALGTARSMAWWILLAGG